MNAHLLALACSLTLLADPPQAAAEAAPPRNVEQLFADFDPRREPLDVQTVREWREGNLLLRYVTFHVGEFKGRKARIAGYYAFPEGGEKRPALLHLHGGGQRAFLHEVRFYAARGYACLSINWGGRDMEDARAGEPNTDWGAVDPTQQNVPGYFNLRPGDKYLDPFDSPRNNNWYLLTLAARRGLTFLEQQPQVDPERLGVYGHSMGGNLTVYVAGSDSRVKAAAPSVGGSGFRTRPRPLLPEQKPQLPNGDVRLFDATLGFESYAPHIAAPLLWLGATNDFHGIMDDTYLTGALVPHDRQRYVFTPHMNHRFTPAFAVARPLWFDQHLRAQFTFPAAPKTRLRLDADDRIPLLEVEPDVGRAIFDVRIYYSIDPDPRARFWRSAEQIERRDGRWLARLPILSVDQPLFAFANVSYRIEPSPSDPHAAPTDQLAISSQLHTATPAELGRLGVAANDRRDPQIDDFQHGWRDWYTLNADNPHHWEYSTRKIADPQWRGRGGERLAFDVQSARDNELVVVLTENFFRSYRGPQREFVAVVALKGGPDSQHVALEPARFQSLDGRSLASWEQLDLLSFRPYFESGDRLQGSKSWAGAQPVFQSLRWEQP